MNEGESFRRRIKAIYIYIYALLSNSSVVDNIANIVVVRLPAIPLFSFVLLFPGSD
jgi:hypothetical protein